MSTNFYLNLPKHEGACEHCIEPNQLHIMKSSSGFEGHPVSPLGPLLTSNAWFTALRKVDGVEGYSIVSEYGAVLSTAEFISYVNEVHIASRRRQYDWVRTSADAYGRDVYLDVDGWTISIGEFF